MHWIFAQTTDMATKEGMSNHLMNLIENVLTNPISVTILFAFGVSIVAILFKHRSAIRQAEIDATLKQEMIQRGMSAEEIERVLAAKSDLATKQTAPYPTSKQG